MELAGQRKQSMMQERPDKINFFSPGIGPNHKFVEIEEQDPTPYGSDQLYGFSDKLKNMEMKDVFEFDM